MENVIDKPGAAAKLLAVVEKQQRHIENLYHLIEKLNGQVNRLGTALTGHQLTLESLTGVDKPPANRAVN